MDRYGTAPAGDRGCPLDLGERLLTAQERPLEIGVEDGGMGHGIAGATQSRHMCFLCVQAACPVLSSHFVGVRRYTLHILMMVLVHSFLCSGSGPLHI